VRISSLRFYSFVRSRLVSTPCAARAAANHGSHTGSDRVMRRGLSLARRSATRTIGCSRNWAERPPSRLRGPATLMGFAYPSQCSPSARPGVCDTQPQLLAPIRLAVPLKRHGDVLCRRRSPYVSAVHPHLPLSNTHRPADFYGYRSRGSLETPSKHCRSDRHASVTQPAPGCCYRGRAEPCTCWLLLPDARPTNPAMGLSGVFSRACRVLFHSTPPQGLFGLAFVRGPPFAAAAFFSGCHPLMGFACDWTRGHASKAEESVTHTGPIDLLCLARRTPIVRCPLAVVKPLVRVRNRNLRPVTSLPSPPLQRFGANSA
jgi:hypothetical protein